MGWISCGLACHVSVGGAEIWHPIKLRNQKGENTIDLNALSFLQGTSWKVRSWCNVESFFFFRNSGN